MQFACHQGGRAGKGTSSGRHRSYEGDILSGSRGLMLQRLVALMPIPKERKAGGRETARVSVLAIDTALRLHRCRAVTSAQGETDCHQGRVLRQPLPGESPFAGPTGVTVGPAADCGRVPEGSPVPDLATCRSGVLHPIAECSRTVL